MGKISELTQSTLGPNDFSPVQRGSSNYRLNLSGAISSYIDANSSYDGASAGGKLVRYSENGHITGEYLAVGSGPNWITFDPTDFPIRITTTNSDLAIAVNGGTNQQWNYTNDNPATNTHLSREYLAQNILPLYSQAINTGAYVYNSGNLTLSNAYNGKTIISTNSTAALYTINNGLTEAFSCKIIRSNSGAVTFTGAPGVTANSFGGSMAIAGRYGVVNLNWISADAYVLHGNL